MVLPWDKLVELALAGYGDIVDRIFGRLISSNVPDPLALFQFEIGSDFDDSFIDLLADLGFTAELQGMADPLASLTLKNVPVLKSWRGDYYDQLQKIPRTYLWDGVNFPSKTPAWRPIAEKAVESIKKWNVVSRSDFDNLAKQQKSAAWTITKINSVKTLKKIRESLSEAIPSGESRIQWYQGVKKEFDKSRLGPSSAELVFRVATSRAWHEGMQKTVSNPNISPLFPYVRVITINDSRRTAACRMMARSGLSQTDVYNRNDPAYIHNRTPRHYNCFHPDTVIQGRIEGVLKSRYSGEMIEIATASGNNLSVTTNHPIATPFGFIPASMLNKGDDLLSYRAPIKERPDFLRSVAALPVYPASPVSTLFVPSKYEQHPPSSIEQVFSALVNSGGVCGHSPSAADDFHGDGQFIQGEVNHVWATRKLAVNQEVFFKSFPHWLFASMNMGLKLIESSGFSFPFSLADYSSFGCLVSGAALIGSLLRIHLRPLEQFRLGTASNLDTRRHKVFGEYVSTDTSFIAELFHRSAGTVFLDEIVKIRKYHFSGHVYDSQTEGGWLVANNIIASNCRCRDSYLTVAQAARLGVEEAIQWQKTGIAPATPQFVPYFEVPMPEGWIPLNLAA